MLAFTPLDGSGGMKVSALEGDSKWLEHILATIDEGIHAVDLNGATIVYNSAAARMDGLAPEDVLGKHVLSAFPSLGPDSSTLLRVLRTGRAIYNRPQTYTNFLGVQVHTVNTTLPILSAGRIVGALEIAKDLTQVKKLSEQVLELQARMVEGGKRRRGGATTPPSQLTAKYHFDDILTRDAKLEEIKRRAAQSAHTSSPILVYGETGTGKELLVQAIHNASPRQDLPFLALNCAAIPAALLEGILFGTVRGSFTGAEDRPGLFELADGGTLFLDEVQSLPLDLQAKLLRVLQEGELMRVGDTKLRRLNVRMVAAMNQRPELALELGSLRIDLYYRLNVVRFDLPPLRTRPLDSALLADFFIRHFNQQFGTQVMGLASEVELLFSRYPWPGNVRELQNALEAAMNLVSSGEITREALPNQLREWELDHAAEFAGDVPQTSLPAENSAAASSSDLAPSHSAPATQLSSDRRALENLPIWAGRLQEAGMDEFWRTLTVAPDHTPEVSDALVVRGHADTPDALDLALAAPVAPWKAIQHAFERIVIERALEVEGGNISLAAGRLGLPRQTLQYRLKQLGLQIQSI